MKKLLFFIFSISISSFVFGQLSGSYTVGGSGGHFSTVVQAVDSLNRQGVSGKVVFNIRPGTYTGHLRINSPTGASATNTILFRPDTGNTTPVIIQYTGTSTNRSVILFNASKYITFDSLTVKARGTSYSIVTEFRGAASNITVNGCKLEGYASATTGTYQTVVYDNTGTGNMANNITYNDNDISGGSHGFYTYGSNTSRQQTGWKITNNNIHDWGYMGVRAQYVNMSINGNKIHSKKTGGYFYPYGLYLYYCYNTEARKNDIQLVSNSMTYGYGMYIRNCYATSSSRKYFANNMVYSRASYYAVYYYLNNYTDFVHNTIKSGSGYNSVYTCYYYGGTASYFRNNICYNSTGGYAMYQIGSSSLRTHNNYYSTGTQTNFTRVASEKTVDPIFNSISDLHINSITLDGAGVNISGISSDIDGDTRTSTRDIGADEYTAANNDLMPVKLVLPTVGGCGKDSTKVSIQVRNNGKLTQTSQPVTVIVVSPIQDTISSTGTSTILSGKTATVNVGYINTTVGGNFVFKLITNLTGEQRRENDTLLITDYKIFKTPVDPVVGTNIITCNNIDTTLVGKTNAKSVYWYEHPDSNYFHKGDSLTVNLNGRDTVWVRSDDSYKSRVGILNNGVGVGTYTRTGTLGMKFDALKTLTIDTITVYPSTSGTVRIRMYNSNGSTLEDTSFTLNSAGVAKLPIGFKVLPGTGYIIDANGSSTNMNLWYTYRGVSYPYRDSDSAIFITGPTNTSRTQYFFFYDWKISVEGCESGLVKVPLNVRPSLKVNIGPDTGYCVGSTFNYTVNGTTTGGIGYKWQNNSTSTSHTITRGGTYWVDVLSSNGCVTRDSIEVAIVPIPTVTFTGGNYCTNTGALTINGNPSGGTISGSGVISGKYYPAVVGVGSHSLTYTYTDRIGCSNSAAGTMVVDTAPKVTYTPPTTICQSNRPVSLGGGSPLGGYYFGNDIQGSKFLPKNVGNATINYVYYALNGCHDTASGTVSIIPSPTVTWGSVSDQCQNTPPFNLGANPAGGTYSGAGITSGNFDANSAGVGLHTITYSLAGSNGCVTKEERKVRVYPKPYISFAALISACEHENQYRLVTGGPSGGTYSGLNVNSGNNTFDVNAAGPGSHTIFYGRANAWCKDSLSQNLVVNPTPKANFGPDKQICGNETVTLDAMNGGAKYIWNTNDTTQRIIVSTSGHYAVTITANDCRGVDTVNVTYREVCVGIDQKLKDKVSVNIFPNPSNGIFNLNMSGFDNMDLHFVVHSIGGQKVYESETANVNALHEEKLDLSGLTDGVYLLNIDTAEGSIVYRITINR